jgi:hypothetical protein
MIEVEVPSRNALIEFPEGTSEEVISKAIKENFPRNGEDVAYELKTDSKGYESLTVEDFRLLVGVANTTDIPHKCWEEIPLQSRSLLLDCLRDTRSGDVSSHMAAFKQVFRKYYQSSGGANLAADPLPSVPSSWTPSVPVSKTVPVAMESARMIAAPVFGVLFVVAFFWALSVSSKSIPGKMQKKPYRWGLFQGYAALIGFLWGGGAVVYGFSGAKSPEVCFLVGAYGVLVGLCGAGILRRRRWAWLLMFILNPNPVVWLINGIYLSNRWGEMRGEQDLRIEAEGIEAHRSRVKRRWFWAYGLWVLGATVVYAFSDYSRDEHSAIKAVVIATVVLGLRMALLFSGGAGKGAEENPAPAIADPLPEEAALFEKVAAELNSDERQPGPWARALAEADGDLLKAQARYIQIRVRALAGEVKPENRGAEV